MKKTLLALAVLTMIAQAGTALADPYTRGAIFENTVVPLDASRPKISDKVGEATCKNVMGIVQWGQCGIAQAMKNGGIEQVNHVDVHRDGCIFYKKINTKVYGE